MHFVEQDAPPQPVFSEQPVVSEDEQPQARRHPWFIDVFLYPANVDGLTYIIIFLVLSFLIGLFGRFLAVAGHYGAIISLVARGLLIGYILYYFTYCIFDSSKGNTRAPSIAMHHAPDKQDLIFQIFLILGSGAICFSPVAVYYGFTQQTDLIFWIMVVCGAFVFPMALLAGVLFDAFDALNPILIISSILRVFLPYCGLILSFCAFGGTVIVIRSGLRHLLVPSFISDGVNLYLLLIAAHLLGRFYFKYEEKLYWEV